MKNIGILGGTFDPIHLGHISIVEAAIDEHSFDHIILMPAKVSPFKLNKRIASEKYRVEMVKAAAKDYENVSVSLYEINKGTISYTYDTLKNLRKLYPDEKLWFILGSDSMISLESWNKGKELLKEFSFVLAPRPGYDLITTENVINKYKEKYGTEIKVLHNKLVDVSSTQIKRRIKLRQPINDLVPEAVERYIYEHRLYKGIRKK